MKNPNMYEGSCPAFMKAFFSSPEQREFDSKVEVAEEEIKASQERIRADLLMSINV